MGFSLLSGNNKGFDSSYFHKNKLTPQFFVVFNPCCFPVLLGVIWVFNSSARIIS